MYCGNDAADDGGRCQATAIWPGKTDRSKALPGHMPHLITISWTRTALAGSKKIARSKVFVSFACSSRQRKTSRNSGFPRLPMLHLDYVSCLLTVLSTVLVGRRKWQGWVVAGANSAIISMIGLRTGQWGFVPANAFCIAIYLYNIRKWRAPEEQTPESPSGEPVC